MPAILLAFALFQSYHVFELPSLSDDRTAEALSISDNGQIVTGYAFDINNNKKAVVWFDKQNPKIIADNFSAIEHGKSAYGDTFLLLQKGTHDKIAVVDDKGLTILNTGQNITCAMDSYGNVCYSLLNSDNKLLTLFWSREKGTTPFPYPHFRIWSMNDYLIYGGQMNWISALWFFNLNDPHCLFLYIYGCADSRVQKITNNNKVLMNVAMTYGKYEPGIYSVNGFEKLQYTPKTQFWPAAPSMNALSINSSNTVVGWYGCTLLSNAFISITPTNVIDIDHVLDIESEQWHVDKLNDINDNNYSVGSGTLQSNGIRHALFIGPN